MSVPHPTLTCTQVSTVPWLWGDDAVADRDSHASRSRHPRHPKRKEEGHRAAGCRVDPNSTGTPSTDFPGERRGWSHGPRATLAKRLPDSFLGGPVRPASLCSKCHPYSWLGWFCFGEGPICRIIRSSVHVKSDQRKQKKKKQKQGFDDPHAAGLMLPAAQHSQEQETLFIFCQDQTPCLSAHVQ